MELEVIGSGSSGNCYILRGEDESIVLEAGASFKEFTRAIGDGLRNVRACLVSHEHGDHAANVGKFLSYSVPVYMSAGTASAIETGGSSFLRLCAAGKQFKVGGFTVLPFGTRHDAVEPLGFLISHPECGVVLFATDTYYLPCRFSGLNNVMIECNYITDVLEERVKSGDLHPSVARRVRQSHMELQTCIDALGANDLTSCRNIVLVHISGGNGDPDRMREEVVRATGINTVCAAKGVTVDFSITPF